MEINTKPQPFLTIGIPTYNRAQQLEKCLQGIFEDIRDNPEIQIMVANNASTDNTEQVIMKYANKYSNLVYIKREHNIGADQNIFKVLEESEGKYCLLHGDDDYFLPGAVNFIIDVIKNNPGSSIYFMLRINKFRERVKVFHGLTNFLQIVIFSSAAISAAVIDKAVYNKLSCKDRFIHTTLNQIYILYSLLVINDQFVAIGPNPRLMQLTWSLGSYSFGKAYIKDYLDILNYFIPYGLDPEAVKIAKKEILDRQIVPNFARWQRTPTSISMSEVVKYFKEYYCDEPYYEKYLEVLLEIERGYTW